MRSSERPLHGADDLRRLSASIIQRKLRFPCAGVASYPFILREERRRIKYLVPTLRSPLPSEANGSLLLPEPLIKVAPIYFLSTTKSINDIEARAALSTQKSCCRPMRQKNTLTVAHSGTPWKLLRTNGTLSLHGVLLWLCPEKYRRNSIPRW